MYSHAWCTITENADLENFEVVIGDGAERPPSNDEICGHVTNTKAQADVASPAMMEIGTDTTPVDMQCSLIQQRQIIWYPPDPSYANMWSTRSTALCVSEDLAA